MPGVIPAGPKGYTNISKDGIYNIFDAVHVLTFPEIMHLFPYSVTLTYTIHLFFVIIFTQNNVLLFLVF